MRYAVKMFAALALLVGISACSKCDVPTWSSAEGLIWACSEKPATR
jgi:uncharacterized protein YcgI (DUF1989 family)